MQASTAAIQLILAKRDRAYKFIVAVNEPLETSPPVWVRIHFQTVHPCTRRTALWGPLRKRHSHTWAAFVSDSLAFLPHGLNLCQISLWLHSLWQLTQIRHLSLDGTPARTQSVMGGGGVDIGLSSSPTDQLTKVELWEAGLWPSLCGQDVLPSLKQVDFPLIFKIGPEIKCGYGEPTDSL